MENPFRSWQALFASLGLIRPLLPRLSRHRRPQRHDYRLLRIQQLEDKAMLDADPVAYDDYFRVDTNTPFLLNAPGVLGNDSYESGNTISAVLDTGPGSGTFDLFATGGVDFTPPTDFSGDLTFTYHLVDETAQTYSNTATVTLHVNALPTAANDSYSGGASLSGNVLDNDSDPENDTLTVTSAGSFYTSNGGYVTLDSLGSVIYSAASNFNGVDSFGYDVSDGYGGTASATAYVAVSGNYIYNGAPSITAPSSQMAAVNPGAPGLTFSAYDGNLISIGDPDAGENAVQLNLSVDYGTLSLGTTAGLSFSSGSSGSSSMAFTGTLAAINAALDGLVFTPTADYTGSATLAIAVDDLGNTGYGGNLTASCNVTMAVVPDPLVIDDVAGATPKNTSYVFAASAGNALHLSHADLGENIVRVALSVGHGTLSLSGIQGLSFITGDGTADPQVVFTGTAASVNAALEGMTYAPASGFAGPDSLQITVGGRGSSFPTHAFALEVMPILSISSPVVSEDDGVATFQVSLSDATDQQVTVAWHPSEGTATRPADWAQGTWIDTSYSEYQWISEGHYETQWITEGHYESQWIEEGHTEPQWIDGYEDEESNWIEGHYEDVWVDTSHYEDIWIDTSHDEDVWVDTSHFGDVWLESGYWDDGGLLVFEPGETLKTIVISLTNDAVAEGIEQLAVYLSDSTHATLAADHGTATIYDDDALPSISAIGAVTIDAVTIDEDASTGALSFTVSDPQFSAGSLVVTATSSNTGLVPNSALTLGGSGANRTISVAPIANASGAATITVQVANSLGSTASRSFQLTVQAVNDAPTFSGGADLIVSDDAGAQTFTAWATGMSIGPADEAGQSLSFEVSAADTGLFSQQPAIDAAGTLTFTPAYGAFGTATVTVYLHDDGGTDDGGVDTSSPYEFTIAVGLLLSIGDVSVNEAAGTATFTVSLSHSVGSNVTVNWQAQNNSATNPADYVPQTWVEGYEDGHWQPGYNVTSYLVEVGYWQNGYDVYEYTVSQGYWDPGWDVNSYYVPVGYWDPGFDVSSYWVEEGYLQPGFDVEGYYDENEAWVEPFWSEGETVYPEVWVNGYTSNPHWIVTGGHWTGDFWSQGETTYPELWVNGYISNPHWIDEGSYWTGDFWSPGTTTDPAWINGFNSNPHWIDTSYQAGGDWQAAESPDSAWTSGYNYNPHWVDTGSYWTGDFWAEGDTPDSAWTSGYTYEEHWIDDGWVEGYFADGDDNGTLTFDPYVTTQTITVRIIDDQVHEADETYFIQLSNVTGAFLADDQGLGTIVDNDNAPNTAPTLDANVVLTLYAIENGAAENLGTTVFELLDSNLSAYAIWDDDLDALWGIAIVGADVTNGDWEFSLDDGESWAALGAVSEPTARLLPADATTRIRFLPAFGYEGSASISIRAWDQTSGSVGGLADTTTNGGTTAFSTGSMATAIEVLPAPPPNNPPVAVNDSFNMLEGRDLSGDVLTNDTDPDGDPLSVVAYDGETSHGYVYVYWDGTFDYRPLISFVGQDSFNYTVVDDRGGESIAQVTINVEALPTITINDVEVRENDGPASFNVQLSRAFDEAVKLNWATVGGTALAGEDYTAAGGELEFAPGETLKTFDVDVLDNAFSNFGESKRFAVALSTPSNAHAPSSMAQATTLDDDVIVSFGSGGVQLSMASDEEVRVDYSISSTREMDGPTSGTLVFAPGETSKSIPPVQFAPYEPEVNLPAVPMTITLSNAENASIYLGESVSMLPEITNWREEPIYGPDHWVDEAYWIEEFDNGYFDEDMNWIPDIIPAHWLGEWRPTLEGMAWVYDEVPVIGPWIYIENTSASETDDHARFTVHVYGAAENSSVTIQWKTLYGTATTDDFESATGTLTIDGNDTSGTFDVSLVRDALRESPETFYVHATVIAGGETPSISSAAAAGTIYDVSANIAVDSDNDGLVGTDMDDESEEETFGQIVGVNDDRLTEVQLSLNLPQSGLSVWLHADVTDGEVTDAIRIWETPDRMTEIFLDTLITVASGHLTMSVYVEGLNSIAVKLTLAAGNQVGVATVDDSAFLRVVKLEGLKLEAVEFDGTWRDVEDDEGLLEFDELRWTPKGIPDELSPYVTRIEWMYRSQTDETDSWHTFADSGTLSPAEASLPLGDWYVQPKVYFAGGAVAMLAQKEGNVENQDRGEKKSVFRAIVIWYGLDLDGAPSNFVKDGVDEQYGGGDAIFPEKLNPGDRETSDVVRRNYDKVGIRIFLDRDVPENVRTVSVKLLVKDPDHYSADPDFDTNDDANHPNRPNDNGGVFESVQVWDTVKNAGNGGWSDAIRALRNPHPSLDVENPRTAVVQFTKDTTKEVDPQPTVPPNTLVPSISLALQIHNARPTNNYRAIVFGSAEGGSIRFAQDGQAIELFHGNEKVDLRPYQQTTTLSVMRTLYVETDSMGAPDLELTPNPSRIDEGYIISGSVNGHAFQINQPIASVNDNQFAGGKITLYNASSLALGTYDVASSTFGLTPTIELVQQVPTSAVWFENLKDDDYAHGVTAADMQVDTSLWSSRLAPAFIRVNTTRTDLGVADNQNVNQDDVTFRLNFGNSESLVRNGSNTFGDVLDNTVLSNRQSRIDDKFWTVYMVGAFQAPLTLDGDNAVASGGSSATHFASGMTAAVGGVGTAQYQSYGRVSIIYRETIRDYYESFSRQFPLNAKLVTEQQLAALVSLHELGHVLGIVEEGGVDAHDPRFGTIMDPIATRALIDNASEAYGQFTIDTMKFAGAGLWRFVEFIPGYNRH